MSEYIGTINLRDVVNINLKWLAIFGYLCPQFTHFYNKVLYQIYACIFVGGIYILYMVSEVTNMVVVFGDIEKMTQASFLCLTHLVQSLKVYVLVVYNSKVWQLMRDIDRKEFRPRNNLQHLILFEDIKTARIITNVFLFMGFATCLLWGIFPFLERESKADPIRLPLSGWYPFDVTVSPSFEFVYIYQTVGALINGLSNISIDTFLSGIIMFISSQLKLLNISLQDLKLKRKVGVNIEKLDDDLHRELIRNVEHHKKIIQLADDTTWLFTHCIIGQFVVSVIIICITMFQMTLVPVLSLQFLSMVLYQACMILEIFLWCYYGNEVIVESRKLLQSVFSSDWIDSSSKFKKSLIYFMTRTQHPLKLYAGYFTLSLETFMAIVKSSWSYFAVLNRVHSREG